MISKGLQWKGFTCKGMHGGGGGDIFQYYERSLDWKQQRNATLYQDLQAEMKQRSFQMPRPISLLQMMENSPTEVANGRKQPLQKR